jgi:catechol 2,3-dioxygenase-like lactoylglutathione lyase family enzyme
MPITVERVDFLSVPTPDMERARTFYVETRGLPLERDTPAGIEGTAGR